jgi:hypothetical protein
MTCFKQTSVGAIACCLKKKKKNPPVAAANDQSMAQARHLTIYEDAAASVQRRSVASSVATHPKAVSCERRSFVAAIDATLRDATRASRRASKCQRSNARIKESSKRCCQFSATVGRRLSCTLRQGHSFTRQSNKPDDFRNPPKTNSKRP